MKNILTILFIILFFTHPNIKIFAVKATPFPITITQTDGSQLTIRLHGDEFYNYTTTVDGYLIIPDEKGIMTYAKIDNGSVVSTNFRVSELNQRSSDEINFVSQLIPNQDMIDFQMKSRAMRLKGQILNSKPQKVYPLIGSPKALVILVNFSDVQFATADSLTAFSNLLNQNGYSANGGTGSAKDYFHDASAGVFNPQFDVFGPVTLDNTMAYYGANDGSGNDVNPRQLIIDACNKASLAGLNFSQYDTDNDGFVDNVFVYYTGYNEAEGGSKNSIWPHKWRLSNYNTKLNGKIIYNYACTSELRGNSGTNMCGIGTFCHEFGHVLGLDDYYVTSGTDHHALSSWNVMDYGLYLNSGCTPPTYCAYDRYFLKWLTPIQLTDSGSYTLDTLASSNKAYLISQTPNRTQSLANNVSSPEFFTFENRQKKGWDAYLSGHGMIIYHINYNATTWASNGPNNDVNAMGVDIVEADGLVSLADNSNDPTLGGDPYPGTSNVTTKKLNYKINATNAFASHTISNITETNGIIKFTLDSLDVDYTPIVTTSSATEVTDNSAIIGGNVINEGSKSISERGVCWSLNVNPTISDSKISKGVGIGVFTDTISNLTVGTTYHCRAYATNVIGTSYGSDIVFTTSNTTDIYENPKDKFNVYPNPTNGTFRVSFAEGVTSNCSVSLFNMLGQKIYFTSHKNSREIYLDLIGNCSGGIYWLKVVNADGTIVGVKRILIN